MKSVNFQLNKSFVNIWELYGVKENPFSTSPLLVKGGTIPIESFVGRKEELSRIIKLFSSSGGSRILVYGDVGMGKTTFVNVARVKAMENGFFTPFKEIATQSEWNTSDFILNTLAAIYATLRLRMKDRPIDKELYEKLENIVGIGLSDKELGIQIAGFGGNYGKNKKNNDSFSSFSLQEFFTDLVNTIKENTKDFLFLHRSPFQILFKQVRVKHNLYI